MVKSKLVEQMKPQIILDKRTESILVNELEIKDHEVYEIILEQEESMRPDFVKRAFKVGVIALKDVFVTEKTDYIKREFQKLCIELDKIFQLELGEDGLKGELYKIFGDNGQLKICLDKLFGDDGKLTRDILDMDNKNSPIGRLRETIEAYFVGKDSQLYTMLDPNAHDSPMSRLRQDIMKELDGIKTIIEERLIKKEIIGKTTQKGFEFEDTLEDFLLRVSKPFGDAVGRVGTEKGKLGNLKGDFVVTLNDIGIKGQPPKIVIEAKAGEHVRLTQKGLLGELDEAMKNREAQFAIAVTESIISEAIGNYREIERDKLICAFGDNGLPLEVAYKVARTGLLLNMYKEKGREIDMTRLRGVINKIDNDLKAVQGIRAKLTSIENTSDAINDDVKSLEVNIRNSLTELQDIIRGGTSTSVD